MDQWHRMHRSPSQSICIYNELVQVHHSPSFVQIRRVVLFCTIRTTSTPIVHTLTHIYLHILYIYILYLIYRRQIEQSKKAKTKKSAIIKIIFIA